MRIGGLFILTILALSPAYSLDHRPDRDPKQQQHEQKKTDAAKASEQRNYPDAAARISRMQSHMARRDREMDRRMKAQKHYR